MVAATRPVSCVLEPAASEAPVRDGLALIGERQLADTHTCIDHAKPHGTSRQLHKCIVGGAAHAVFDGKIMVRPGAQRTDSSQSSRNLLLTGKAHVVPSRSSRFSPMTSNARTARPSGSSMPRKCSI